MKLMDLYTRVIETTGLDVMTIDSLRTAVANCMADLTSRGYKTFKEMNLEDFKNSPNGEPMVNQNLIILPLPNDIRKTVYLRLMFGQGAVIAQRYSLSNKRVGCRYINGAFRSLIEPGQAIYYIKGDNMYIEWHTNCGETICDVAFGYYQKLTMPSNFPTAEEFSKYIDTGKMMECEIDIRPEFEDAVVFYAAYFYYARYVKDSDKINHYLSQYKYYVEDITHELAYEDDFNEEDAVIKLEEDD
jgi:hypothetical protein